MMCGLVEVVKHLLIRFYVESLFALFASGASFDFFRFILLSLLCFVFY